MSMGHFILFAARCETGLPGFFERRQRKVMDCSVHQLPGMTAASTSRQRNHSPKGLREVSDSDPGIRRIPRGRAFGYLDAGGKPVRNPAVVRRIKSLVIPPAWKDVWICPAANGHIQATGR